MTNTSSTPRSEGRVPLVSPWASYSSLRRTLDRSAWDFDIVAHAGDWTALMNLAGVIFQEFLTNAPMVVPMHEDIPSPMPSPGTYIASRSFSVSATSSVKSSLSTPSTPHSNIEHSLRPDAAHSPSMSRGDSHGDFMWPFPNAPPLRCWSLAGPSPGTTFTIHEHQLAQFVRCIACTYSTACPYHNFTHAVNVLHGAYQCLNRTGLLSTLAPWISLCILIAALGHDAGHTGRSNDQEHCAVSDLATRYTGTNVLEQHHCALTMQALRDSGLMGTWMEEHALDFADMRALIVTCILHTDPRERAVLHDAFDSMVVGHAPFTPSPCPVWTRQHIGAITICATFVLHCADLIHTVKPWTSYLQWVRRIRVETGACVDDAAVAHWAVEEQAFLASVITQQWERLLSVVSTDKELQNEFVRRARNNMRQWDVYIRTSQHERSHSIHGL